MVWAESAEHWFKLDRSPLFDGWRAQLQQMVDQKPEAAPGPVCAVVWPAGHQLTLWFPTMGDPHSLIHETHVLDLRKDVAANEAAVNGSTYLATQAWVQHVKGECHRNGNTLMMTPRKAGSNR